MKPIIILGFVLIIVLLVILIQDVSAQGFTEKEGLVENERGWFVWKKFTLHSGIPYWALEIIQPKIVQASELPLQDRILNFLDYTAEKYGLNKKRFIALAKCESNFIPTAKGDWRSETGEYLANGLFQWHRRSWDKYSKVYSFKGNYENWQDQAILAATVIRDGGIKNWWNCGKYTGAIK